MLFSIRVLGYHAFKGNPFGEVKLFDFTTAEELADLAEARDYIYGVAHHPITIHVILQNEPLAGQSLSYSVVHTPDPALTKAVEEAMVKTKFGAKIEDEGGPIH